VGPLIVQDKVCQNQQETQHHRHSTHIICNRKPGMQCTLSIKMILRRARQTTSIHAVL
jgi:hypothetical protein